MKQKSLWYRLKQAVHLAMELIRKLRRLCEQVARVAKEIRQKGLWRYLCEQMANAALAWCMPHEKGGFKVWVLRTMALRFPRSLRDADAEIIAEGYLAAMYYEQYGAAARLARVLITRGKFGNSVQERIFCNYVCRRLSANAPKGAVTERAVLALRRMGYRVTPGIRVSVALRNEAPTTQERSAPTTGERTLREFEANNNPQRFRAEARKELAEKHARMVKSGRKPSARRSFA